MRLQHALVTAAEGPRGLRLPEHACRRAQKLVVELLLVIRALPLRAVEAAEGLYAPLHVPHPELVSGVHAGRQLRGRQRRVRRRASRTLV